MKDDHDLGNHLEAFIAKVKQQNEVTNQSIAEAESSKVIQTRKSARENFAFALLLGVAEAKQRGGTIEGLNLKKEINWQEAYKRCLAIGTEIESGMWVAFKNEVSKDYGRKFRQL